MKIRSIFTLLILTLLVSYSRAQDIAIKTNLLYGGYTYTPNLSLEIGLGKRSTLDLGGGYNPWNLDGTAENNKKLVHWLGEIEYRYWLCQRFSGHFLGVHVLGSQYNIAQQDLPLIFGKEILDHFKEYLPKFKKIIPRDYERMLTRILQLEEKGLSSEQAKTEAFYAIKEGR